VGPHLLLDRPAGNHQSQKEQQFSGRNTYLDTNEISDQFVQAKNVNINITDVFLGFTTVQQI
jgi:hypothetical protein